MDSRHRLSLRFKWKRLQQLTQKRWRQTVSAEIIKGRWIWLYSSREDRGRGAAWWHRIMIGCYEECENAAWIPMKKREKRSFTALTWEWSFLEVLKSVIWPKIRNQIEVDAFSFVFRKFRITKRQVIISSRVKSSSPRNYPHLKFSQWKIVLTIATNRMF